MKGILFFKKLKKEKKPETGEVSQAEGKPAKKRKAKWSRRRKIIVAVILVVVVLAVAGGVIFFVRRKSGQQGFFGGGGMGNAGFALSGDMVGASGVISVGVTEESFDVENLTTDLIIEEVYVSSNEDIEEGTKILKLTDDSVEEARDELEKVLKDAELAYRAGTIEYEQNKITAQYDYDSAILAGEQASEIYTETVSNLESSVEKAEEALADAQDQIAEYQSYVNDDSYKSYFKVDEYQAIYDANLKALTEKMEEWGVSWPEVTGGGGGGMGMGGGGGAYSYSSILASLYQVLEQNEKDLKQAQSDYEDALTNAAFELQTLELKLPSLEQAVTEAKENYEIQAGQAKLTYETSLASAERAQSDYETALEKAEADYETLKDDYEDAQENLDLFESSVGDGYFYASGSGTILRLMVRAEQKLTSESTVFMYSNPDEMSVTVSVDQTDIAKLSVGDEAYVMSTSGDGYSGSIQAISPVTSSESRTNVTYSVTVALSGDTSSLKANQTVTVIFGITADEVESMTEQMQMPDGEGNPGEGGEVPDGEGAPGEGGQTPDGEGAPGEGGQMPDGEGAPGEGGQMPDGEGAPGEGGEMPDGEGAPGEGGQTPDGEGAPGEGGQMPDGEGNPGEGGQTPDGGGNPGGGGQMPDGAGRGAAE